MERLPTPPTPFPVPAVVRAVAVGTLLWRIYYRGGRYPVVWNAFRDFGPVSSSRFDHHLAPPRVQNRAILCAADGPRALITVLSEVFQRTRAIDRSKDAPWLVGFELTREVRLLDTSGTWPHAAGGGMVLNSGSRKDSRAWSRAIYAQYPDIEGISYPSSLIGNPSVAFYERAQSAVPAVPAFHRALNDPALRVAIRNAARAIRYIILP